MSGRGDTIPEGREDAEGRTGSGATVTADLLEEIPDAAVLTDSFGSIRHWTANSQRLFGYSAEEALGQCFCFLVRPDVREAVRHRLIQAIQEVGEFYDEVPCTRKDGTEIVVGACAKRVRDADGQPSGLIGIHRDLTRHRTAVRHMAASVASLEARIAGQQKALNQAEARQARDDVGRRQSEASLRVLSRAVEQSASMVVITDTEGRIEYVNPRFCEVTGYAVGEVLGETPRILKSGAMAEGAYHSLWGTITSGGDWRGEFLNRKKNGDLYWTIASVSPVKDADGRITHYIANQEDITDRKRIEEALQESESKYRELVEQNLDGIYVIQGSRFLFANSRFLEMLGYTAEELALVDPRDTVAPEYRAMIDARIKRRQRGDRVPERYVLRLLRKDGSPVDVEVNVRGILKDGSPAIQGCIRDIGEQVRAAEAVAQGRERLRSLVEALPDGVCLLDDSFDVLTANDVAREYLEILAGAGVGDRLERLGGTPVSDVLKPQRSPLPVEVVSEGAQPRVFEVMSRSLQAADTAAGQQAPGGYVLVLRDCTREREYQGRLQQQDRLAAVGQMAAGIAHDFNNLLTVILGFAQMLELREDVPDSAKVDLNRIFAQGQRAAQLIRQILDFSRETRAERQHLNLVTFLKEAIKMMERTLPETVQLSLRFDRNEHLVQANVSQLQQVFTNLAVNARDAMPDGGELSVSVEGIRVGPGTRPPLPDLGPGEWVVWRVRDTGTGIPRSDLPRIFEPFYTTKREGEGTGLGLAQVYGIVGQHDGAIDVDSEPGAGTTFTIYLPRSSGREEAAEEGVLEVPRGSGQTILVAEDDQAVRQTIVSMLERLGYRVLAARNGKEALALFDRHESEVDVLLTDLVMPEVGGLVLASRLRQRRADLATIVMSGYAMSGDQEIQPSQEVDAVLKKPVSLTALAGILEEVTAGED